MINHRADLGFFATGGPATRILAGFERPNPGWGNIWFQRREGPMSRPRFLGDNDLNDAIVIGARHPETAMKFSRRRHLGLPTRSYPDVLEFAAQESWILVSRDVNMMREVDDDG